MREGGYSEKTREIVAKRTLGKIRMNQWNHEHLQRPLYRTKEQRKDILKEDKGTWFRKMGATSTLMVPTSKDSLLAKKLRLVLATNPGPRGTSTKVVEVPGPSLFSGLAVNNPFKPERCRRKNCPLLDAGEPCLGKCAKENVLYEATCNKCKPTDNEDGGRVSQYIGETGRTLFIRRGQHLSDFRTCAKKGGHKQTDGEKSSFIWDHFIARHKDDQTYNPEKGHEVLSAKHIQRPNVQTANGGSQNTEGSG